ncbi:MAG: DNA cytosine methyltransferase [Gammaproteobacteria bacterium]|nr:DNA cytosine methyltransferase [Gammaproteobacteria bacterium]MYH85272.1 DNA cytosine methyltransferase [Gammaproteobacteria bacterium]MYK04968.1 DNA cytosine methyltransferase [Gammaproteobacteria bacterium]
MRAVELFTGAGGLGIGVSQAGFEPVAVVERDRYCCDTIRENQEKSLEPLVNWPLVQGDVRDFDYGEIGGDVDLVSGGPPCQPFSLGGKHRGYLDTRDMFPEAIRAVRELKPRAFLFENVKGLTRPAFANYFEYMRLQLAYPDLVKNSDETWTDHLARLERHHTDGRGDAPAYRIVSRVLNAADYGVPQRRERVFIVGFRSDLGIEWSFPAPTHSREALLWDQWRTGKYWESMKVKRPDDDSAVRWRKSAQRLRENPETKPWRTVRQALADLPDPEFEPEKASRHLNHKFQPGARSYPGHTGSPCDEPAKTLKAGDHGVPGGENMLRRTDGSLRYFSIRESARLQTFPDDYLFHGTWTESMRQLGNAVPVKLASVVANSIREHLERGKSRQ